jgi:hypothetical protein
VNISFFQVSIIGIIVSIVNILQVNALLETLDLTDSAQHKGHFSLYNCLVLGHTRAKYNGHGVQRVYCNSFPAEPFYDIHCLDLVMIRPPGLDHGAFVVVIELIELLNEIHLGLLDSIGSRIVYELDHRKPILYVIPVESILGKLPVVPVGNTGTIPHLLRNHFPGAPGDRRLGSGDGFRM